MAARRPLVRLTTGQIGELPSGDTLLRTGIIELGLDGGGVAIVAGQARRISIDFDITITKWEAIGDVAGAFEFDLSTVTFSGSPQTETPTSIDGSAPPALTSNQRNASSSTLTGWTPNVNAGQKLKASCVSNAGNQTVVGLMLYFVTR